MLSTNIQIEEQNGKIVHVVPRGASVLSGGTAEKVKDSVERLFNHLRTKVEQLRKVYEHRFGHGSWPGPNPERIGLDLLGERCLLMTDTCNTAKLSRTLLEAAVTKAVEEKHGAAAWAAMSEDQRADKATALGGDCWQHMRNIMLDAGSAVANIFLKDALEDSLDEFSVHERISTDLMQLIRAAYKQFHHGKIACSAPAAHPASHPHRQSLDC